MKNVRINNMGYEVAAEVDATGLFCPVPILMLTQEIEKLGPNEIVELIADDPGILDDIPSWCKETGNTLLFMGENEEGILIAYVQKTGEGEK